VVPGLTVVPGSPVVSGSIVTCASKPVLTWRYA
jgi:hypothetical protein